MVDITNFKRLAEVLLDNNLSSNEDDNGFGYYPDGALHTWLTLQDYQRHQNQPPKNYFLFLGEENYINVENEKPFLDKVYYTGLDYIINNFINRRIAFQNDTVFQSKFSRKFSQIKNNYELAFSAWYQYYHLGVTPTTLNAPLFADFYSEHFEEFIETSRKNGENEVNSLENRKSSLNSISSDINNVNNITNGATNNENKHIVNTTNRNDGSSNTSTTENKKDELTKNSENETIIKNNETVDSNSKVNSRNLFSDMPQSNIQASTENPIKWNFATNLTDAENNTVDKKISVNSSTTNSKNDEEVSNISENNMVNNTSSLNEITGKTEENGNSLTNLEEKFNSENTTNKNLKNEESTENSENIKSNNIDITDLKNTRKVTDVNYKNTQSIIDSFLNSSFANYFFDKLYNEFEEFFLSVLDLDNPPLYCWKIKNTFVKEV